MVSNLREQLAEEQIAAKTNQKDSDFQPSTLAPRKKKRKQARNRQAREPLKRSRREEDPEERKEPSTIKTSANVEPLATVITTQQKRCHQYY